MWEKVQYLHKFLPTWKNTIFTREEAEKAREKELNKEKSNVQDEEAFQIELEKTKNMADKELKEYIKAMAGETDND